MTLGHVRDYFAYLALALPGADESLTVEFLVDTGFDGDLALPSALIARLDTAYAMDEFIRLADGSQTRRPVYEVVLEWDGEPRITNILALDGGTPLLGVRLLAEHGVFLQMTDGGEVTLDPL